MVGGCKRLKFLTNGALSCYPNNAKSCNNNNNNNNNNNILNYGNQKLNTEKVSIELI